MKIQEYFKLGMKKEIPDLLDNYGFQIDLGPGQSPTPGCDVYLEYPEWDADTMPLPFEDNSVDVIHMYHFLEHVRDAVAMLRECERVLKVGGHMNIVVPHGMSQIGTGCLDHKQWITEETWDMFDNVGFDKLGFWKLKVHANFICGVVWRSLAVCTQIVKI